MPSSDRKKLLSDTIRNRDYEAFRAEAFESGLAEFRSAHGRNIVPLIGWLVVAACLVFAAVLALNKSRVRKDSTSTIAADVAPASLYISTSAFDPTNIFR